MKKTPSWKHQRLVVYHGCDDVAASAICTPRYHQPNGIDSRFFNPHTDFGAGFYTTTFLYQAENWANLRFARNKRFAKSAAIVEFEVSREALSRLEEMAFVSEGAPNQSDFWSLVRHCRKGADHSHPSRTPGYYDVVYGPVALPAQGLVVKDCDQISFHTQAAIDLLVNPKMIPPPSGPTF